MKRNVKSVLLHCRFAACDENQFKFEVSIIFF